MIQTAETDFLRAEITKRYGRVRRARGSFLYTKSGVRLTDLYREGGRAIFGQREGGAFLRFKNALNRGETGFFDTDEKANLVKSLCVLLNSQRTVYAVYGLENAFSAAAEFSSEEAALWLAWDPDKTNWSGKTAVIVAPPLAWGQDIFFVCIKPQDGKNQTVPDSRYAVLRGINVPSPLCAAFSRSIYDFLSSSLTMGEKDWFIFDTILTPYWHRKGPYLFPKIPEASYRAFLLHCLDAELVISPDYTVPSIVPFGAGRGVFGKLKKNPFFPVIQKKNGSSSDVEV